MVQLLDILQYVLHCDELYSNRYLWLANSCAHSEENEWRRIVSIARIQSTDLHCSLGTGLLKLCLLCTLLQNNCSRIQTMLPALSAILNLYEKVETVLEVKSTNIMTFFNLNASTCFPWVSVINPLIVILFVERYRKYMSRMFRGGQGTGTVKPLNNGLAQRPKRRFETTGPLVNTTRV